MKQKFFICRHCGNLIALLRDKGVPVYCCGEPMEPLLPGQAEGSGEKHIPVVQQQDGKVQVSVGAAEHPMTREHYIEWICLETERGIQYAHLNPEDKPRAEFPLCPGDAVRSVYAFCNQHDLWRM